MSVKNIFSSQGSTKSSGSGLKSVFGAAATPEAVKIANVGQDAAAATTAANEANSVSGLFKNTISDIWDTVKGFGSGIISPYTNPDTYEQGIEQSAPQGLRQITAPVVRTFAPLTEQLNKDIASAIVLNNPKLYDEFTSTIAKQTNPSAATKDAQQGIINATTRTPAQIVGDVTQAVLGAYAPELFGENLGSGFTAAAIKNAQTGFTFGAAQAASSGSTDPKEIANIVLQNTIGGTILGIATEAVHRGVATDVPSAIQKIQDKTTSITTPPAVDALDHIPEVPSTRFKQTHEEYARSQGYEPYVASEELPVINYEAKGTKVAPVSKELPTIDAGVGMTPEEAKRLAQENYARSQGYEPITPDEELPVIGFNGKTKNRGAIKREPMLVTKKVDEPKSIDDYTYEPISEVVQPLVEQAKKVSSVKEFVSTVEKNITQKQVAAIRASTNVAKAAPTGDALVRLYRQAHEPVTGEETSISGLAKGVSDEALKEGFASSLGKLPEYGVMNMDHQRNMARDLIAKNPDLAMQVARGEVPSPVHNLLPESVYTAFRIMAKESTDREIASKIYHQLSEHSPTTAAARAMGQRIKALDSGIHDDPIDIIQEIKEAREKSVESKVPGTVTIEKKKIATDIKRELKKAAPSRQSWEDFVTELQCKY